MKKGLSGAVLKWIAMFSMLIDHCTAVFYESGWRTGHRLFSYDMYLVLRGVGRLAFPIYCFLLVEGFHHTRNVKRYLLRLLVFGLVSEVPFDLAFHRSVVYWEYQNVYFTLLLGLLAVTLWERSTKGDWRHGGVWRVLLGALFIAASAILAWVGRTDYGAWGVLVIAALYLFRRSEWARAVTAGGLLTAASTLELAGLVDFVLFHFYNGQRGRQPKYFFYVFYPAHLLLLVGISRAIFGI